MSICISSCYHDSLLLLVIIIITIIIIGRKSWAASGREMIVMGKVGVIIMAGGLEARFMQKGNRGFQGYGFHLSTNHFVIL